MSGITLTEVDDATIPTPAAGKATLFLDDAIGPAYKDDAAAVHPFQGEDGELTYQDHGNTGATETVAAATANVHRLVLDSATVTLTLTTGAASGTPSILRIRAVQDGTGGRLLAFPGSVVWVSGAAPVLRTAAGAVDIIDLETEDAGTTWYGTHSGAMGPAGGGVAIPYTFSTTTTDADPGAGTLRLSNATQTSATVIRADLLSSDGTDWTAVLATLADSTNTVKGHIRLFKTGDPTKWLVFSVSSLASPAGYKNITVANVAGSASSPFANGDAITLTFTRNGDVGASGTASVATDPIWDAAGDLAVGTGADTAARLAIGAAGGHVSRINGAVAWDSGTGFPTAATGDRFWRTDLAEEFYYDGTRWLSTNIYEVTGYAHGLAVASAGPISGHGFLVGGQDIWLLHLRGNVAVITTNDGSNYWHIRVYSSNAAGTLGGNNLIGGANTSGFTASVAADITVTINAMLDVSATPIVQIFAEVNGVPGLLRCYVQLFYRRIAT